MRHCYAGNPSRDPVIERNRPLTPEGKATALAMANAMRAAGEVPKYIFVSPFIRAQMTADIVGKALGVQVNVIGDLSPVRPLENTIADLISSDNLKRVCLIGHVDNTTPAMNSFDGPGWDKLVMGEVRRVKISRDDCSWSMKFTLKPSDIGCKDYKS